jgi:hypothetical protein
LKGTHPGTIPARFGLIWFSGFRGEDLNVIFYQQFEPNFGGMVLGWPPSKMCPVVPTSNQDGRQGKNRNILVGGPEMPDTILEGDNPRSISAKFG